MLKVMFLSQGWFKMNDGKRQTDLLDTLKMGSTSGIRRELEMESETSSRNWLVEGL